MRTIYIRVDCNSTIGYGHFFRCLAFAQYVAPYSKPQFITTEFPVFIQNMLATEGFDTLLIPHCAEVEQEIEYIVSSFDIAHALLIIDGYGFTSEYEKLLILHGAQIIAIDDLHNRHFYAHYIINQSDTVREQDYSKESYSSLFSGFSKALIRKEFFVPDNTVQQSISDIFITLGGTYFPNVFTTIIKALQPLTDITNIHVLAPSHNNARLELQSIQSLGKHIHIYENIDAKQIIEIACICKLAICPASVSALELSAIGIGLFVGITAENQRDTYDALRAKQMAIAIGNILDISAENLTNILQENLYNTSDIIRHQRKYINNSNIAFYEKFIQALL